MPIDEACEAIRERRQHLQGEIDRTLARSNGFWNDEV
jgi:hypothetical protein